MEQRPKKYRNCVLIAASLLCAATIRFSRTEATLLMLGPSLQSSTRPLLPKVEFVDVAKEAGLTARHVTGDEQNKEYLIEVNGSGVALFDYNNDDLLDVFLVNGTTLQ